MSNPDIPQNNVMRYFALTFSIICVAAIGTSLFTEHWVEIEVVNPTGYNFNLHRGLMQWVCISQKDISDRNCVAKYPLFPGWLKSVFICMCVAFGTSIVLVVAQLVSLIIRKHRMYFSIMCTLLAFITFILLTIAIGIFGGEAKALYFETYIYKSLTVYCQLGWSYWISIMAIIIAVLVTSLETVQIFLNSNIGYPSSALPPEAVASWKYTL